MSTISIFDMQRDPRGILRRVENGETVVVIDHNKAIAEIRPVPAPSSGPRPFGLCAGEFTVPDDFDAPLPAEVLRDFEDA